MSLISEWVNIQVCIFCYVDMQRMKRVLLKLDTTRSRPHIATSVSSISSQVSIFILKPNFTEGFQAYFNSQRVCNEVLSFRPVGWSVQAIFHVSLCFCMCKILQHQVGVTHVINGCYPDFPSTAGDICINNVKQSDYLLR